MVYGLAIFCAVALAGISSGALAQDLSPLQRHHVWLPMTGFTDEQVDDAKKAGYDTVMFKVHPPVSADGKWVDFEATDRLIERATSKDLNVILAILDCGTPKR